MSIASPINLILLSLFVVLLYWHFRPKAPVALPRGPPPVVFKTYTPKTLIQYNGLNDQPVYLAVRGRVFDVSPGRNFYGPVREIPVERLEIIGRDLDSGAKNTLTMHALNRAVLMRTLLAATHPAVWLTRASMRIC
jgi:predicted heme/steroid binding protein